MNKNEVSEIKKVFKDGSGLFTLNKVLTAFVNDPEDIPYKEIKSYYILPEDEAELIMKTLKKVLSGSIGKGLLEFAFPNEQYDEGGSQALLYKVLQDELQNPEIAYELLDKIAQNYECDGTYAVFCGLCSYSVMKKAKDLETIDDSGELYKFIICGICPVKIDKAGLVYSDEQQEIVKKHNIDRLIAQTPQDGFLYPVFSSRSADINSVMYYTHTPKNPNRSVINEILGCEFERSCEDEKEAFQRIVETVAQDELSIDVINNINDNVSEMLERQQEDEEESLLLVGKEQIEQVLADSGVSKEKLERLPNIYENVVGEDKLNAQNIVDKKTVINSMGITVNVSPESQQKVSTKIIDGKKCLIIEIDDDLKVNGLSANIK